MSDFLRGVIVGTPTCYAVSCLLGDRELCGAYDTEEQAMAQAQAWREEYPDARITVFFPEKQGEIVQ